MLTLLCHAHTAASTSPDDQLKNSIIRRHDVKAGLSEVLLDSAGEVKFQGRVTPAADQSDPVPTEVSNSFCNHDFVRGQKDTNTCDRGVPIITEDGCRHAATYLKTNGETVDAAADHSFVKAVNEGGAAALPFPKGCFIHEGKVFLNPTEPEPDAWQGTPLCQRLLYPTLSECTGEFEAITTAEDCLLAASCVEGLDGCKKPELEYHLQTDMKKPHLTNRPKGCFREPTTDCFNFNHLASEPSAKVQGKQVCQLKKA